MAENGFREKLLQNAEGTNENGIINPENLQHAADDEDEANVEAIRRDLTLIRNLSTRRSLKLSYSSRVRHQRRYRWRVRLGEALESTVAHVILVVLLLLDLAVTAVDIVQTLHSDSQDLGECIALVESCQCVSHFEHSKSWEYLRYIAICILLFLLLNVLGLLVAYGFSFFKHAGYVLDLCVVSVALGLELLDEKETAGGLLVVLNLWRIVMVAHGMLEVTEESLKTIDEVETLVRQLSMGHKRHIREELGSLRSQRGL